MGTAQTISSIQFEGLKKTKEAFLLSRMECQVGTIFNASLLEKDLQHIRNLNLFFNVKADIQIKEANYQIKITIEEALSIYPILQLGKEEDNFYIGIGATDINWRGEGNTIGGFYKYYDRHSFQFYQITPWHKKKKTGHLIALGNYSSIEPLYFNGIKSYFNFDNYGIALTGFYNIDFHKRLEVGHTYMYEHYLKNDTVEIGDYPKDYNLKLHKSLLKVSWLFNYINYHYERLSGWRNYSSLDNVWTYNSPDFFFKLTNEFQFFQKWGKNGNFALRQKLGFANNPNSPFPAFVQDSHLNLRGVGNRSNRGSAEVILNLEYRHTLFRVPHFSAQIVSFMDLGNLRAIGTSFNNIFEGDQYKMYYGGGIRFHIQYIYNFILRVDYSLNAKNMDNRGFIFGIGQYF